MSEVAGRAGGNIRHLQHRGTKGTGGTRADRASLLHESMRELDPAAAKIHAAINPNIVLEDTPLNVAMVNDGEGGFRRPTSTKEVLDYGDERIGSVHRKWNEKSFETTLIAVHLPKTLCDEVSDFYPVLNTRTGGPARDPSGEPRMRSRWVAKDRQQAIDYFDQVVRYYAENVLTGGQAAIHGYDINFDESTPHIQIMADTLAPDPKHEGELRVDASRMWGAHRDVTVDKLDKSTGEPEVDPVTDDVLKVMEQPKAKMSRYQQGLREHMHAAGYPVELDYDPDRHLSGLGKAEYTEAKDAEQAVWDVSERNKEYADGLAEWRYNLSGLRNELDEREGALDEREGALDEREGALDEREGALDRRDADTPRLRAKAVQDGRDEGLEAAQTHIRAEVQRQVHDALGPGRLALQRQQQLAEKERDKYREKKQQLAGKFALLNEGIAVQHELVVAMQESREKFLQTKRLQAAKAKKDSFDSTYRDWSASVEKLNDDPQPGD